MCVQFAARPAGFVCQTYQGLIQSYCDAPDPFCSKGNSTSTHQSYGKVYGQQALDFIKKKLAAPWVPPSPEGDPPPTPSPSDVPSLSPEGDPSPPERDPSPPERDPSPPERDPPAPPGRFQSLPTGTPSPLPAGGVKPSADIAPPTRPSGATTTTTPRPTNGPTRAAGAVVSVDMAVVVAASLWVGYIIL